MSANIMIIDDTPANLELLESILTGKGDVVRLFLNGKSAFASALKDTPDLILLDIMMPDMDGFEVCNLFKAEHKLKDIPVIFISAKGDPIDKVKAFKSGGVDYITKPFYVDEVLARVETHYKLKLFRTELENKNKSLQNTLNDLAATQDKLVQSRKMASLGTLTAGLAHEINNPINAVNSSSISLDRLLKKLLSLITYSDEVLKNNEKDSFKKIGAFKQKIEFNDLVDGIQQLTNIIRDGAQRTTTIIKSLKSFTHLDQAEKKYADIHASIDNTLTLLRHDVKNKIRIEKKYDDIPKILCYPGKLNQVFMNLFTNAIDSIMKKGVKKNEGIISIHTKLITHKNESSVKITISDTGIGMSQDIMNRIFEPFFTTKDIGEGSGLGMSISHGIIKNHNGTITVESEVNVGTTFFITIPVS